MKDKVPNFTDTHYSVVEDLILLYHYYICSTKHFFSFFSKNSEVFVSEFLANVSHVPVVVNDTCTNEGVVIDITIQGLKYTI